jgi:peptidyl-prolyl cis-trans isomerase B (cyclophilin B)
MGIGTTEMFKNAKVAAIALILLAATSVTAPAHAAERAISVPGCAKSTAKGHAPAKVKQPTVAAKSPAKTLTITTNCGPIVISLLGAKAPITVTSIASLANAGYYNKSLCHRLTTEGIFVLQCGDPSGTGSGGPAYTAPDENLPKLSANSYPAGSVAMANSGPNTNGSQFFIVYDDNSQLGPNYTLWGKVVKGLEIVKAVAALGSDNSNPAGGGVPNQPISIEKAISR